MSDPGELKVIPSLAERYFNMASQSLANEETAQAQTYALLSIAQSLIELSKITREPVDFG